MLASSSAESTATTIIVAMNECEGGARRRSRRNETRELYMSTTAPM
jgi:hypothetical protein